MEGETPASSENRLFAIERSEMSERRAPSEDGDGGFALNVSMGAPEEIKREPTLRDRAKQKSERRAPSVDLFGGKSK